MSAPGSPSSLNWKEIDLVLGELDLAGLFVHDITQPDQHTVVLEAAGRGRTLRLLIRLAPPLVRMHATARHPAEPSAPAAAPLPAGPPAGDHQAPPRGPPKRFAAFLRARIRGGRIIEAAQVGKERIVRLAIHRGDADTVLWIRLWSNAGNAILTDPEGRIIDAFYRRPKRGEIAGGTFTPPEPDPREREYSVHDFPGEGSFNERLDAFARGTERLASVEAFAASALRALHAEEGRLEAHARSLEQQLDESSGYERLKDQGDLILAHLGTALKGDRWLDTEDSRIELDPSLTPSENAQAYFARFKRARAAVARLTAELEEAERKLARTRAALEEIPGAEAETADPETLRLLLRRLGLPTEPPAKHDKPGAASRSEAPGLRFRSGPYTILVGRSAVENDELLRRHVRGNDTWFHCRDFPGAYVFVRALPGKSLPLEVMLDAGNLAVHYSKAKSSGAADVYYTAVKYLRRPRDAPRGLVLPTMERNLRVRHEPERVERLKRSLVS